MLMLFYISVDAKMHNWTAPWGKLFDVYIVYNRSPNVNFFAVDNFKIFNS